MNYTDLESFVIMVEEGSISAAARALGVPKSTVSRRIARLEEELSVELLRRASRSARVTGDGELLYRRAHGALRELRDLGEIMSQADDEPHGELVLTAPHEMGRSRPIAELLVDYARRYPRVSLTARLTPNRLNLLEEGIDVAFRAHSGPIVGDGELMSRTFRLPPMRWHASAAYLEARGVPRAFDELLEEHDLIAHRVHRARPVRMRCQSEEIELDLSGARYRVDDFGMAQQLTLAGAGVALMPSLGEDQGQLLLSGVLPTWHAESASFSLLWPSSRHLSARVRAFVEMAAERFQSGMAPLEGLRW